MDETYIKLKGQWKYLYRAVDIFEQFDFSNTVIRLSQHTQLLHRSVPFIMRTALEIV